MTKKQNKGTGAVPPQLIGILEDAVSIGASSFRLEPNPPHIMAAFGTHSRAMEIDFEAGAGREMLDYLAGQVRASQDKTGRFVVEFGGKCYACQATVDWQRGPQRAEVSWT